jgi:hypothetical protein
MDTPYLLVLLRYASYLSGVMAAALLFLQKSLIPKYGLRRWQSYLVLVGGFTLVAWNAGDSIIAKHSPRATLTGTVSELGEDAYPRQHYYYMTFHVNHDGVHSRRFDSSPFLEPFAPTPIANGDTVKVTYLDWEPHAVLRIECVSGRTPGWFKDSPDRTGQDWIWEALGALLMIVGVFLAFQARERLTSEPAI